MITLESAFALQKVGEAHGPVRALHLDVLARGLREEGDPVGTLLACADTAPGFSQVQALAFSTHVRVPGELLEAVVQLQGDGRLPALRQLIMTCYMQIGAAEVETWSPHLARLQRAGCTVRVLSDEWDPDSMAALQELRRAMPDPDKLLLGMPRGAEREVVR